MNFLAHAYLSFGYEDVLVGNMISDFVKGKKRYDFPPSIQNGIELHRRIDEFTDAHPATAKAKGFFKPAIGLYAGAFVDVVYDHFLALDEKQFNSGELSLFAENVYGVLTAKYDYLPLKFQLMLPYMKQHNWLLNYGEVYGIERSFQGIVKRAKYLQDSKPSYNIFIEAYDTLHAQYEIFFPELKAYASTQLQQLLNQ